MINACLSKRCQQYLGFSSKIGLPVCLEFKDGCPVQFLNGTDKCSHYQPTREEDGDELRSQVR